MDMRTCHWCGKRYDADKVPGYWQYSYCSKRCYTAGEAQRKKEKENSWLRRWWRQRSVKWKIIIIGGLLIFGYIWSLINGVQ